MTPQNKSETQAAGFQDFLRDIGMEQIKARALEEVKPPKFSQGTMGVLNEKSGELKTAAPPKQDMSVSETELYIRAQGVGPEAKTARATLDSMQADKRRVAAAAAAAISERQNAPKPISAKEAMNARGKLLAIKVAKDQLAILKEQAAKASGVIGPLVGALPGAVTESGSNYDAAVDSMRQSIIGLTRTPGVGSMSDFETRLSQAQLPERTAGMRESSVKLKIASIESMLNVLEQGYNDILSEGGQVQDGSTKDAPPPTHLLKEGVGTKFSNGQTWTLRGGVPSRVQ
jgi:hypothetical protein